MASGFGKNKVGRCYSIFSTFETCMNTEPDSSVCYDFRKQYFNCLHVSSFSTVSERQRQLTEERKDTLVLASQALQSAGGTSAPAKQPGESST